MIPTTSYSWVAQSDTGSSRPVRTIVGAITTLIDIRIGHFSKESIAGSIISSAVVQN